MIRKVYVQFQGEKVGATADTGSTEGVDLPVTVNCYDAWHGFSMLGVDTVPFHEPGGIDAIEDLTPETCVHGYIGPVRRALKRLGIKEPTPKVEDYPEELTEFLGRKVWLSDMRTIRGEVQDVFIKPVADDQKLFVGHIRGPIGYLAQTAHVPDDTEIQCSEPMRFLTEYRCFILEREIVGVRHYKGDYRFYPDYRIIEAAMFAYKSAPVAYTLDFGVTEDKETRLIEANDSFSLGAYGLPSVVYARMIEARWDQMVASVSELEDRCSECGTIAPRNHDLCLGCEAQAGFGGLDTG